MSDANVVDITLSLGLDIVCYVSVCEQKLVDESTSVQPQQPLTTLASQVTVTPSDKEVTESSDIMDANDAAAVDQRFAADDSLTTSRIYLLTL